MKERVTFWFGLSGREQGAGSCFNNGRKCSN